MILRRLARPMLSAIFVSGGINALRQTEGHAQAARPLLDKILGSCEDSLPDSVPRDAQTLVQIDGVVKLVAGTALALGRSPRAAALLLLGSLTATTVAAHRFWEEEDPEQRAQQQIHFLKNVGLGGGLLLAAVDTEGRPSVAWRARHSVHATARQLEGMGHRAQRGAHQARQVSQHRGRQVAQRGGHHAKQAGSKAKSQKSQVKSQARSQARSRAGSRKC